MKTIYVCSPYRGDVKKHKQYARQLTAAALSYGFAPVTPHLYMTECLNDNDQNDRAKGLSAALAVLERCDALVIGADLGISEGMTAEINFARGFAIPLLWARTVKQIDGKRTFDFLQVGAPFARMIYAGGSRIISTMPREERR